MGLLSSLASRRRSSLSLVLVVILEVTLLNVFFEVALLLRDVLKVALLLYLKEEVSRLESQPVVHTLNLLQPTACTLNLLHAIIVDNPVAACPAHLGQHKKHNFGLATFDSMVVEVWHAHRGPGIHPLVTMEPLLTDLN